MLNRKQIQIAIKSKKWQKYRLNLKGKTTKEKLKMLDRWLEQNNNSKNSKIQVENYINALKRGGQI